MRRSFALVLALFALGCSESSVREDDAGLEDSGALPTDAGIENKDGGTDAGPVDLSECGNVPPSFDGALCEVGACAIVRNETFPDGPHFRNDSPAIAISPDGAPIVMLAVAEGGYDGYLAERAADGTWSEAIVPFAYATGSATFDPDGTLFVSSEDGAFGHDLWTYDASGWSPLGEIPTTQAVFAGALVRTSGGCFHTAHEPGTGNESSDETLHLVRDASGAWTGERFGDGTTPTLLAAMAVPESGVAQLAWNEHTEDEPVVRWASSTRAPEEPFGRAMGAAREIELGALTEGSDDVAYVLATIAGGLHLATRRAGLWSSRFLRAESTDGGCAGEPSPGATCTAHRTELHPIAIVTSGSGDVRLLWSRLEITETFVGGECFPGDPPEPGPPPPPCEWMRSGYEAIGALEIADPSADPPAIATLGRGTLGPYTGTAAVDATGNIHLALYELEGTGAIVRYVMLSKTADGS